ncbi:MAG: hypothetical protein PGN34_04830 [Methylobacterium frigidaeris]
MIPHPSPSPVLRVPALAALVLVSLTASVQAARSPFRTALEARGGCGVHRILAERRLGSLEAPPGVPARPFDPLADLFGKPVNAWTEADIRDAVAAYSACEAREQVPSSRRDAVRPEAARLEQILRRLVGLTRAKDPLEDEAGPPEQAAAHPPEQPGGRSRERRDTAFVPPPRTAPAPAQRPEALPAAMPTSAPAPAAEDGEAAASPTAGSGQIASADPAAAAAAAGTGRGPGERSTVIPLPGSRALSRVVPMYRPAAPPACLLTLAAFRQVRSDMLVQEVEDAIGCPGSLDTATMVPGIGEVEIYTWSDDRTNSRITMTFYDKRLKRKSQRGLD